MKNKMKNHSGLIERNLQKSLIRLLTNNDD